MDFTWKARWVKDGNKTPDSTTSSYAGVVSWEKIRISLTYAVLLGLPVISRDIKNVYLQAPSEEKHFIICGPEFGIENVGKVALIIWVLYGGVERWLAETSGIISGSAWHIHVLLSGSRCLVQTINKVDREGRLWVCLALSQRRLSNVGEGWSGPSERNWKVLGIETQIDWPSIKVFGW